MRAVSGTKGCELNDQFILIKVFTFLIFSGAESHTKLISQGPKCASQIWKRAVIGLSFLPLDSADVFGA